MPERTVGNAGQTSPRFASGTIDAEGRYRMTSFRLHDGVIPGTYRVVIDDDLPPSPETGRPLPEDIGPLPEEYANERTSKLEVVVEDAADSQIISFMLPAEN